MEKPRPTCPLVVQYRCLRVLEALSRAADHIAAGRVLIRQAREAIARRG